MVKKTEPIVAVWGLQEYNSRRLKRFDFGQRIGDGLWAYPVFTSLFTSREAALAFADLITEDYGGADADLFRAETRKCVRRVNRREIPRASRVMVDTTALRDPGDNVAGALVPWGSFYDRLVAETN